MNYKQVGSYDQLRQVAGDGGPRDPFATGGRNQMGYVKGEAERERLRQEIARIEGVQKQKRERGEGVIAEQYNVMLEKLRKQLSEVKG